MIRIKPNIYTEKIRIVILPAAISFCFITASLIAMKGAFIHPEIYDRFPHLLSGASLMSKIFDSKIMDYDLYQARELSYLGDQIDAALIFEFMKSGYPNMVSLMHYLLSFVAAIFIYFFALIDLNLGVITSSLVLAAAWATPCLFYGGNYFRSAKIGAASSLVICYILLYRMLKKS